MLMLGALASALTRPFAERVGNCESLDGWKIVLKKSQYYQQRPLDKEK